MWRKPDWNQNLTMPTTKPRNFSPKLMRKELVLKSNFSNAWKRNKKRSTPFDKKMIVVIKNHSNCNRKCSKRPFPS